MRNENTIYAEKLNGNEFRYTTPELGQEINQKRDEMRRWIAHGIEKSKIQIERLRAAGIKADPRKYYSTILPGITMTDPDEVEKLLKKAGL
jgi:hypothetical protein